MPAWAVSIMWLVAGAILGGFFSWLFTHIYYRKSLADSAKTIAALREAVGRDAADTVIAQRLDCLYDQDKDFLVALYQHRRPIPRFAIIIIDGGNDGTGGWGGSTAVMTHSVVVRSPSPLTDGVGMFKYSGHMADDRETMQLSERGKENAEYLVRKEHRCAKITSIDDSDQTRRSVFNYAKEKYGHIRQFRQGEVYSIQIEGRPTTATTAPTGTTAPTTKTDHVNPT